MKSMMDNNILTPIMGSVSCPERSDPLRGHKRQGSALWGRKNTNL